MSRLSGFTVVLLASVGMIVSFHARSATPPASAAGPAESVQQASADSHHAHAVPQPGDRNCLRDTGSLIPAKKGECLPVHGSSYTGDELRNTGTNNNARALQMLDPSIRVGGH